MPKFIRRKKTPAAAVASYWPIWTRRLFESLQDIPWLPLTAIGTLFGALLLFLYFRSIDYFPNDLSLLIGLGLATVVVGLILYATFAFGLLAPAVMYRQHRDESPAGSAVWDRRFSKFELMCLQFGSVGLLFGWIAYKDYRDCGRQFSGYTAITLVCVSLCLYAVARILIAKGTTRQRMKRLRGCGNVIGFSVLSMTTLGYLLPVLQSPYFDFSYGFFVLWVLTIVINALLADRLPVWGLAVVGVLAVWIIFIALPPLLGKPSFFPQMVASAMGVRHAHVEEFRVPSKTCQLIQSGIGVANATAIQCSDNDWSEVKMQVLSSVGEQWFIEVKVDATQGNAGTTLRMSIPKTDVHLVQRSEDRDAKHGATSCAK